ncbi:hypothetical protein BBJ28_00016359 [Nothophytophthora sp. Chile5]|nr:hypothetical protein BBJ28_00016359 [Nothophytophthora sp. Chile5]
MLVQVDVMEVFAVLIVYCEASVEQKLPLLFELFDFDHSHEISQDELMLLLLCTTRGLCKAVGMARPTAEDLETLSLDAFARIDRDRSGQISLQEFSDWVLHEPSVVLYLSRFAATRVIYDNQIQYDLLLKELCATFVHFALELKAVDQTATAPSEGRQHGLACSLGTCDEIIRRHCPTTETPEISYLLRTMVSIMRRRQASEAKPKDGSLAVSSNVTAMISMDVFCLVLAPYVAFLAADNDAQHTINLKELKVLLWLLRGSEPSSTTVDSFMKSLDRDRDGSLSALEWVSFALESDQRTGSLSFATQMHLLFVNADRNGDAVLSLQELHAGLSSVFAAHLARVQPSKAPESLAWEELTAPQTKARRRMSQASSVTNLVAELAKEVMQELDTNQSQRIEWYEFRLHLDFLEQRVRETEAFIRVHVLDP